MRNLALTKKLTDEFCLFLTDMIYVRGQLFPYIFLTPRHKQPFSKMATKKPVGTISHESCAVSHSNLMSRFLFVFLMIQLFFGKYSLKTRWLTEDIKKNWLVSAIS